MSTNDFDLSALWQTFNSEEWPQLRHWQLADNVLSADLFVPNELSWFAGHFPEQAVLPGVVQTHWAGQISQCAFPVADFCQVNGLKFKSMIMPDTALTLRLQYKAEKNSVAFTFVNDDTVFSTASLVFVASS